MPKFHIKKDDGLAGPKAIPNGKHTVRLDGFEPDFTKDKKSYNFKPIMKIINNQDLHDRRIFDNLNSNADWIKRDFCHCFGVKPQIDPQDPEKREGFPGEFVGELDKPKDWKYRGELLGKTGEIEVAEVTGNSGKTYVNVKRYICRVPGCTERHSMDLIG